MYFDLTDLKLFLHVTDANNITRGAQRSHMAVSSASERIARMEASLGVPLLERQPRGVKPTAVGFALRDHARKILSDVDMMLDDLSEHARGLRGHVRILSNTAAATEFLPKIIASYLLSHPQIDIELEELPSHEIVQRVAIGMGDAGIVADTFDLGGLQSFAFADDQLVLVVPKRDVLARRKRIKFQDVVEREFVGLPSGNALQSHIAHHAAQIGQTLRIRIRLANFDSICGIVESGVGTAIVPLAAAKRCKHRMDIAVIELTDAWASRHLKVCVKDFGALTPHAKQVVSHLCGKPS